MSLSERRILVVTADEALTQAITEQLALDEGMVPIPCDSVSVALQAFVSCTVRVVITDYELADASGLDLCRELRRRDLTVPLIMLVPSEFEPAHEGIGYVVKPFRLGTLMARVNDVMERQKRQDGSPVAIGSLVFHPGSRTLVDRSGARRQRLTEKEAQILTELVRAGGSTVDRATLLERLWGYDARIETHTLETHIWRLRRKIEDNPSQERILFKGPDGYRIQF